MDDSVKKELVLIVDNIRSRVSSKNKDEIDPAYITLGKRLLVMGEFMISHIDSMSAIDVNAFIELVSDVDEVHTIIGKRKLKDEEIMLLGRKVAETEEWLRDIHGFGVEENVKSEILYYDNKQNIAEKIEEIKDELDYVEIQYIFNKNRLKQYESFDDIRSLSEWLMTFLRAQIESLEGDIYSLSSGEEETFRKKLFAIVYSLRKLNVLVTTTDILRQQKILFKLKKINESMQMQEDNQKRATSM